MKVILASGSPRRKELMDLLKIDYEIIISNADEILEIGLTIGEQAKKLAYIKAKSVFDNTSGDRIVIGSDTMVIKNDKIYGKPIDKKDAIKMLKELKDGKHKVITSLCILVQDNQKYQEYLECDISNVYISDISEKELINWVEKGKPVDKAGAYAIQSEFAVFIDKIEGNYNSIVGLPINKVYKILKKYIDF